MAGYDPPGQGPEPWGEDPTWDEWGGPAPKWHEEGGTADVLTGNVAAGFDAVDKVLAGVERLTAPKPPPPPRRSWWRGGGGSQVAPAPPLRGITDFGRWFK